MTAQELREKYLKFFETKGHRMISGSSLIPENDPTVLFTTAGMHSLTPYLLGETHPMGKRLVNFQKCLRTGDINEVGDSWHLTFFEMLGNWSLGDYFKKEAIEWSFEFLVDRKWLGVNPQKLYVTVFAGDKDAPLDQESIDIWQEQFSIVGIEAKLNQRIFPLLKKDNWWGPVGETGPCGPDTEMFYDTGKPKCSRHCQPGCTCGKYAEIWNDVFMEYNKKIKYQISNIKNIDFEFVPLRQKNVDTGMGIERTIAILNGYDNVYETELFQPIIKHIEFLASQGGVRKPQDSRRGTKNLDLNIKKWQEYHRSIRIIADHIKAATFILGDDLGIIPSNLEQGYVVRRLIRRAIRYGKILGIREVFTFKLAQTIIELYKDIYPELLANRDFILEQLVREEERFEKTLNQGLRKFEKITKELTLIDGKTAFGLYDTYGFPLELTQELAKERGIKIDEKGFWQALKKHQQTSKAGFEKRFKGGLLDQSEVTVKLHTVTHLLHQALKDVLGGHIKQKGSNITPERLRFDFSHPQKLKEEELKRIEERVNQKIKENLKIWWEEMPYQNALKKGAIGLFPHKYGDEVKVYFIGNYSKEICGGPHIKETGELCHFKILKEEAVSSGVRRIKGVLI